MTDKLASITDLPLDILVLVFPYVDAKSFLSLCSTCKAFQQPSIRLDPAYWSFATRSTFRIPNQPVVQHDGIRWQRMYRRLLTQSRVYTWGNNTHSRLGHSYDGDDDDDSYNPTVPRLFRRPGRRGRNIHCPFPREMDDTRNLGVIADMQCGGWSTTLLTAKGTLHTVGVLDGGRVFAAVERLRALRFPAGYPSSADTSQYLEPAIAIRQFSAGRSHVLAVSDGGKLWSWYHVNSPALQIKFANIDVTESASADSYDLSSTYGRVKQVVAGWSLSSAYIHGTGIVIWDPVERDDDDGEATDTMLVMQTVEVPKTGFQRTKGAREDSKEQSILGAEVGSVVNYILLEHFLVFVTDIGRVFYGRFEEKNKVEDVFELRALRNEYNTPLDVQGSFRHFALFKNGEVITSNQDYLEACWSARLDNPEQLNISGVHKIPALQHNNVISVAFGDYHYLALHSSGKITSYGKELGACGALGLGGEGDNEGHARGIVYDRFSHDGQLLPHAFSRGRQVWFDQKMKEWARFIIQGGEDPDESAERRELFREDRRAQGEISEWLEQESRAWDDMNTGDDDLGAYYALGVSAAGWHSGALVLVNEELATKTSESSCLVQSFPRLKLADGTDMPGTKPLDLWRDGRPDWQIDDVVT